MRKFLVALIITLSVLCISLCVSAEDIHNDLHYYGEDGKRVSGWQTIEGFTYYFSSISSWEWNSGYAYTGMHSIADDEDVTYYYYFNDGGQLQTNAWYTSDDNRLYYFGDDGKRVYGWQTIGKYKYFFDDYGAACAHMYWIYDEDGNNEGYYFNEKGQMQTNLFYTCDDGMYYFGEDGKAVRGWQEINGWTYYFDITAYTDGTYSIYKDGESHECTFDKEGHLIKIDGNLVTISKTIDGLKYDLRGTSAIFKGPKKKSVKEITIPATVTVEGTKYKVITIDSSACKGLKQLNSVSIGKNITTIGNNAFSGCIKLKKVSGGSSVKTIGIGAFQNCKVLSDFSIGSKLTTIGDNGFSGCAKLKAIPDFAKLTTIGNSAFKDCVSLTKVTLGTKVKQIGKNAFKGCKKLNTITIKTTLLTKNAIGKDSFKGISSKATFKCPKKKLKNYTIWLKNPGGAPEKAKFK